MSARGPRPDAVDVVVPTYNHRDMVIDCVKALDDASVARVIVVDDVSSDDTVEALRSLSPGAVVVPLDEHRGLSAAFNAGTAAGDAPFVLFLNDDVFADPGSVDKLVHALAADPTAVFAGGRLVDAVTGATQDAYVPRSIPTGVGMAVRVSGVERRWPGNPVTGAAVRRPLPESSLSVTRRQPAGACLLVRRAALEELGGWDERFWFWYEDVDLCVRLLEHGHGLWEPRATFRHVGSHSTAGWEDAALHGRLYHGMITYSGGLPPLGRSVALTAVAAASAVRAGIAQLHHRSVDARIYRRLTRQSLAALFGRPVGRPVSAPWRRRAEETPRSTLRSTGHPS